MVPEQPFERERRFWAPWWWRWRQICRARRAEEFRLFSLANISGDADDTRAWAELRDENHTLGVW